MSKIQGTPWVMAKNLMAKDFKDEAVPIHDLFRECLRSGQTVIENRTFTNCRIEGPAVVVVLEGVNFDSTDFGYTGGDVGKIVWRTESRTGVVGAIPIRNCEFKNCSFFAVGYTGPEPFLQQILALKTKK